MTKLKAGRNDADQRLDRFLRKYLKSASLGSIYKMIRKDVKVNGVRAGRETMIREGDEITLYISDADLQMYTGESQESGGGKNSGTESGRTRIHRSFGTVYEDDSIIIVEKPFGLLTHGDGKEKKNTLVNQVTDYLIEKGEYVPRTERSFRPAAVNRLDRNTTGLVMFGKNAAALRALNSMIRSKDSVHKYYLTVVSGELTGELHLRGALYKDESRNTVTVRLSGGAPPPLPGNGESGEKYIETIARPKAVCGGYTLAEIELVTGRTHQIRAHMAGAGYPVIGDSKYGSSEVNKKMYEKYGLKAQLLHAYRLEISSAEQPLEYLEGKSFTVELPAAAARICSDIFGKLK